MKLFTYATSPYARKVRMMLDLKGIAYEPLERCYSIDRKEDLFSASDRAEVPALILDDGRAIADSTIICEFIEETHPEPPLFPKDPYERARMRALEDLCDRSFDAVGYGFYLAMLRDKAPEAAKMKEAARKEFHGLLAILERALAGENEFLCGQLSVADLAAICYVPGASAMGVETRDLPALNQWTHRMRGMAAVKADSERIRAALSSMKDLASEFEGPDGRIHWRDSRLEWPIRHGFIDLVAREFHEGRMMFPPNAT